MEMEKETFQYRDYDDENPPRFNEWVCIAERAPAATSSPHVSNWLAVTAGSCLLVIGLGSWTMYRMQHNHGPKVVTPLSKPAAAICNIKKIVIGGPAAKSHSVTLRVYLDKDSPPPGCSVEHVYTEGIGDAPIVGKQTVTALAKDGFAINETLTSNSENWIGAQVADHESVGLATTLPKNWDTDDKSHQPVRIHSLVLDTSSAKPTLKILLNQPVTDEKLMVELSGSALSGSDQTPITFLKDSTEGHVNLRNLQPKGWIVARIVTSDPGPKPFSLP